MQNDSAECVLSLKSLCCSYGGDNVVNDLSFDVLRGQKLCILGPNGSGKTTLLRALAGIISYRGSAKLMGREIKSYSRKELSQNIAMFSQPSQDYFGYTVYDTVAMGRYVRRKSVFSPAADDSAQVMKYIDKLGLREIMHKPVTELSGGQLQRVLLARTFAQEPSVILLDEPLNHLDISYQTALVKLINEWAEQKSPAKTVIGVIHELNFCPMLFERAILIDGGKIAADGDICEVLKSSTLARVYNADVAGFMRKSLEFWG